MANIANLLPPTEKGEPRRGGRVAGQTNRVTRILKHAILDAAETSKHCPEDDKTVRAYCKYLADEHPPVFANLMGKLIPVQVKAQVNANPPQRLTADMNLETMVSVFTEKIRNPNYRPALIEHERDDDGDETE